jgi:uncharacterized protein
VNNLELEKSIEPNLNVNIFNRGEYSLFVERESGAWAILPKNFEKILDSDKSINFNVLRDEFGLTKEKIEKLYKTNILKFNNKTCFDHKIYKSYGHKYPNLCVLHITNNCNLRCSYCFANCTANSSFDISVIYAAIDKFFQLPSKHIYIDFHGGEPMLYFSAIKDAVIYSKKKALEFEKDVSFIIQTNGTLFTEENVKFIKENNIILGVSLDGPQRIHDRNRYFCSEKGSFVFGKYKMHKSAKIFTEL